MKRLCLTVLFCVLIFLLIGCPPKPAPPAPTAPPPPPPVEVYHLKMQSSFAAGDILHASAKHLVDRIMAMSGGRIKIDLLPAGAIVAAFEVLDAVHKGILDMGYSWTGYWLGKHPAAGLFSGAPGGPFGMDEIDFATWYWEGGGEALYREFYRDILKMDVHPIAVFCEIYEPQGWFKHPLKDWADFKGIKFRAAGLAAWVYKEAGATVVILPGGEIVPALEKGLIDAAEFSDPTSDMALGIHDILKFYHMPSIIPNGFLELLINKKVWDTLPADLKAIIEGACDATSHRFFAHFLTRYCLDLDILVSKHGVTLVRTPDDILLEALKAWDKIAAKHSAADPFFAKVYESQRKWAEKIVPFKTKAFLPYDFVADYYWKR